MREMGRARTNDQDQDQDQDRTSLMRRLGKAREKRQSMFSQSGKKVRATSS